MDSSLDIFGLLGAMIVTLGAVFLCAFLYKRVANHSPGGTRTLQILSSLSLGSREKLILVNAGNKQLLLGVTPHQVTHLCELDVELEVQTLTQGHSQGLSRGKGQKFSAVLNNWLNK